MKELSTDLYRRCRDLLSECDEFDSNESLRSVFDGTEIEEYSDFVHDKNKSDDRVNEVIRALKNRRYQGRSVLAIFLEILGRRYPEGDDTKKDLMRLAQNISTTPLLDVDDLPSEIQQTSKDLTGDEKRKKVLVICGPNEAARIEMYDFLKNGAGFTVVEWEQVKKNGLSVVEALKAAFNTVQAVLLVFTGDELVKVKSRIKGEDKVENGSSFEAQPTHDMFLKAGIALGINHSRTILVALGKIKHFHTSFDSYIIKLTNADEDRRSLMEALKQKGCIVTGKQWLVKGRFDNIAFR